MLDHIDELLLEYRTRGLLLDTSLLLLYIVGSYDPGRILSFKRTNAYEQKDFELLIRIIEYFEVVATTPHVLTEVSNFLGQLPGQHRKACVIILQQIIPVLRERYRPASSLCDHEAFPSFRLTDAGIAESASGTYLALTDDLPLYHYLSGSGQAVLNFNHLRMANW